MKNVVTLKIWGMNLGLWFLVAITWYIFYKQGGDLGVSSIVPPLVITLVLGACALFPKYFFRKEEDYPVMRKVLVLLLVSAYYICGATLLLVLTQGKAHYLFERIFGIGLGLFFISLGNIMPKLPRSNFAGIRFSWTMTSDEVWREVHYWVGIETVITGTMIIIASIIFPIGKIKAIFVVLFILLLYAIFSSVHSYFIAKRMHNTKE